MEKNNKPSSSASSPKKTERKVIEKNRRDHIKSLHSQLYSLLPASHATSTKEAIPLVDQIDKAIEYIKELKEKIDKSKEKKDCLSNNIITGNKRPRSSLCPDYSQSITTPSTTSTALTSPKLEIKETVSGNLEISLTCGLENQFLFTEIIRIVSEEGLDVVNANFSVVGNSVFHIIHAQVTEEHSTSGFEAAKVIERLNKFINGSTSEETLQVPQLSDFDFSFMKLWDFEE